MIVHKSAIQQHSAVRFERPREHVSRINWSSPILRRPGCLRSRPSRRIRRSQESARKCHRPFSATTQSPADQWVGSIQSTDRLGAAEVDGKREPYSPRSKRIRNARRLTIICGVSILESALTLLTAQPLYRPRPAGAHSLPLAKGRPARFHRQKRWTAPHSHAQCCHRDCPTGSPIEPVPQAS